MTKFEYDTTTIAERYDAARQMPEASLSLWLESIRSRVHLERVHTVLDLGCGTGRFSAGLADLFGVRVVGVDPSRTMLAQASKNVRHPNVTFCVGLAERIPLKDESACLVLMSMVIHHVERPIAAAKEIFRVLRPGGVVCIRNSTQDLLDSFHYLRYFPEAMETNRKRLPSKREIIGTMGEARLSLLSHDVIAHKSADNPRQYCDKIARRALSDLVMLSDADFHAGIEMMRRDTERQTETGPIFEPIDLFVFGKEAE